MRPLSRSGSEHVDGCRPTSVQQHPDQRRRLVRWLADSIGWVRAKVRLRSRSAASSGGHAQPVRVGPDQRGQGGVELLVVLACA